MLPTLFPLLRDHTISNAWSLVLAAALGAVYAFVVGIPLMRLSGIAAGISTLAVLGITYNILTYWTSIGPGSTVLSLIPTTTDYWQATVGAIAVICVAFAYQRSRFGRQLRAAREDPAAARAAGIDIHRQRLLAFTLSGALSGFAGGLYVHLLGSIATNQVYLDLTFLTLAMLVVGGISSLFGAVIGAITISLFTILLGNSELGIHVFGWGIKAPAGTSLVGVAIVMLVILLLRPSGITGGQGVLAAPLAARQAERPRAAGARARGRRLGRVEQRAGLVAHELERRAVQAGDREALALREVDLDHLDSARSSASTTVGEPVLSDDLPGSSVTPFTARSQYSSSGTSTIRKSRSISQRTKP